MTIKELINECNKTLIENKIQDSMFLSRRLLEYVINKDKQYLIINQNEKITIDAEKKYKALIQKVINGKPIQYITNKQEFMKMNFYVDENVLIPQPDTEILVEEVIDICNKLNKDIINVLDICTGSGVIGISIAKYCKNTKVTQSDISPKAIQIAKLNCENNILTNRINFIVSDMFESIEGKFDIIVSNPPYIKTKIINKLDKQVQAEPNIALDGGVDGLDFYRKLIHKSSDYLEKNGYLCMEIGYDQKDDVTSLIEQSNKYDNIYSKKDLSQNDRIVICKRR